MAKYCPLTDDDVVYLECLDCKDKLCQKDFEKDRFYLFVAGSWFNEDFADLALKRKKMSGKQIILVSSLKQCEEYAKKRHFLFRKSTEAVSDCLVLCRKPDAGALIFANDIYDQRLLEKIKQTGIKTHVKFKKSA